MDSVGMAELAQGFEKSWIQAQDAFMPRIVSYAGDQVHHLPGFEKDDVINELLEVLWRCVRSYDPDEGARFHTLFWNSANRRMADLVRYVTAQKRSAELITLEDEATRTVIEARNALDSAEFEALSRINLTVVSELEEINVRRKRGSHNQAGGAGRNRS